MPYPRAARYANKKGYKPPRGAANTPPRRNQPEDVPLGSGMLDQAKRAKMNRQQRIDELVKAGGG